MRHLGYDRDLMDGVYERERLRRMARKLGLRLLKFREAPAERASREQPAYSFEAVGSTPQPKLEVAARSATK